MRISLKGMPQKRLRPSCSVGGRCRKGVPSSGEKIVEARMRCAVVRMVFPWTEGFGSRVLEFCAGGEVGGLLTLRSFGALRAPQDDNRITMAPGRRQTKRQIRRQT